MKPGHVKHTSELASDSDESLVVSGASGTGGSSGLAALEPARGSGARPRGVDAADAADALGGDTRGGDASASFGGASDSGKLGNDPEISLVTLGVFVILN